MIRRRLPPARSIFMDDSTASKPQAASGDLLVFVRGISGALAGAALGFAAFTLLLKYSGVYAMAIPGALVGLVCGYCINRRSLVLGVICAGIAAANMVFAEWWNFPFKKDEGLGFFLQNLNQLSGLFWLSLLLGGGLAFWFGQGNERTTPRARS
jgi:hypothetical protein